jgi:glucose dehydrogenase
MVARISRWLAVSGLFILLSAQPVGRLEFGNDTWLEDSSKSPSGVSAWAPLSGDEALGYVYLPFSTPSSDYYGGDRPGDNLFGTSGLQ